MTTNTDKHLRERDEWEAKLSDGTITLADALMLMLGTGTPATPYLFSRLEQAFQNYQYGGPDADLAAAFGISVSQRERKKQERATWVSHVRFHVDGFHQQGFPKQDPGCFAGTAFHQTGDLLHRSPSQIFDTYYRG